MYLQQKQIVHKAYQSILRVCQKKIRRAQLRFIKSCRFVSFHPSWNIPRASRFVKSELQKHGKYPTAASPFHLSMEPCTYLRGRQRREKTSKIVFDRRDSRVS